MAAVLIPELPHRTNSPTLGGFPCNKTANRKIRAPIHEIAQLCGDSYVIDRRVGFRDRLAYFPHRFKVRPKSILETTKGLLLRIAGGSTSGNIR
jgi:hypothetical protein